MSILAMKSLTILINLFFIYNAIRERENLFLCIHTLILFILLLLTIIICFVDILKKKTKNITSAKGYSTLNYYCSGPLNLVVSGFYIFILNVKGFSVDNDLYIADILLVNSMIAMTSIFNIFIYYLDVFSKKLEFICKANSNFKQSLKLLLKA